MQQKNGLVTIITPVYNGAAFLDDCIQSVRNQSYRNFRYFIVDNCSTDGSCEIAESAAAKDDRITLIRSGDHVGPIQNWNRSLSTVCNEAAYVKFVHADDWLFPDCVRRMVDLFESEPDVGIVSAYRLEEDRVSLDRLPSAAQVVPGIETLTIEGATVARAILTEHASVLGSPTALMFRADPVRQDKNFFLTEFLHADKEACLRLLQTWDFGFVRQVLTFTRRHNESVTSLTNRLDTRRQENLLILQKHGPEFLSESEYRQSLNKELRGYYRFLAQRVATRQGREFWQSHAENLEKAGLGYSRAKLATAFVRLWMNPADALKNVLRRRSQSAAQKSAGAHEFLNSSRQKNCDVDERIETS